MDIGTIMLLVFIFILAAFLGVELISKVPSQLHTPLMSGTNAISGITIVGAIAATAVDSYLIIEGRGSLAAEIIGLIFGFVAIFFATVNVIGGYFVTDRMLGMFKKKGDN
ncbi:NAD(P) transhydrogenase subunit alpha [Ruminococcaceae bacterium YRB3002]|nr:NAD(P) transhydrogenase subunit alpha [Ruminococcaceae bacterium YRB3002]